MLLIIVQSLVADINNAVILYRTNALAAYKDSDMQLAEVCVHGLNSMLPIEHALIFDDTLADEETRKIVKALCVECDVYTELTKKNKKIDVISHKHRVDAILQSGLQRKMTSEYILCNKCGHKIPIDDHDELYIYRSPHAERMYMHTPPRIGNVMDASYRGGQFWAWFKESWRILEAKHRINREEAAAKNDDLEGLVAA